jgi:hypothetical protein
MRKRRKGRKGRKGRKRRIAEAGWSFGAFAEKGRFEIQYSSLYFSSVVQTLFFYVFAL